MLSLRLQELRESLNMNRRQFAQELNVNYSTYTGYESGAREPGSDFLILVSEKYSVSVDWLVGKTDNKETQVSVTLKEAEFNTIKKYRALDEHGREVVDSVLDIEYTRCIEPEEETAPATKLIPLFGSSFAAGVAEPDTGNAWESFEVDAGNRADFAIRINGDSMEPYLADGSIAFGVADMPKDGEVGAFMVDGEFLCKQYCRDALGNVYLFSLNRERKDADYQIWHDADRNFMCFGKIIMKRSVPLPVN